MCFDVHYAVCSVCDRVVCVGVCERVCACLACFWVFLVCVFGVCVCLCDCVGVRVRVCGCVCNACLCVLCLN